MERQDNHFDQIKQCFNQNLERTASQEQQDLIDLLVYLEKKDQEERLQQQFGNHEDLCPKTVSMKKRSRPLISQQNSNRKRLSLKIQLKNSHQCGICLSEISIRSAKLECNHMFCAECLHTWVKQCSKCPFCRRQCSSMLIDGQHIAIEKKIQNNQEGHSYNEVCYICQQDQNDHELLICDGCDFYSCHYYCDSDLHQLPRREQNWYCHFCSGRSTEMPSSHGYMLDDFVVPDNERVDEDYYE